MRPQLPLAAKFALTAIAADTLMVDTIVVTKGPAESGPFRLVVSPADDTQASYAMHLRGTRYIEFDFDSTAAGAVSMNAYWRLFTLE